MVIAVKYCGGCNCSYDRVGMVEGLRREFPGVTVINAESRDGVEPDLVLVICGCTSVCASHMHLDGKRGKIIMSSEGDFAVVRRMLHELSQNQK